MSSRTSQQRSSSQRNITAVVYFVIHDRLPKYCHYMDRIPFNEPIETVNSTIVGVYKTEERAEEAARRYFFETLGYSDSGESENGGYHYDYQDDAHGWDEEVWVDSRKVVN